MVQLPLGPNQANTARQSAKTAWEEKTSVDAAKMYAIQLNERWLGQQYLTAAHARSGALIDYWNRRGILEPPSIYAVGEPGCDVWDET